MIDRTVPPARHRFGRVFATPFARDGAPFPSIISHGYPGNRFLMSHIGENLASKGFVTVSIDHKDSTYDDQKAFGSTLYNRPFDQLFVLNEIDRLSKPGSGSFLAGAVDASPTGIIGYSMGGYGVVNVIGGGYTAASARPARRRRTSCCGARRRESRVSEGARSADQSGDRDRAVGHAGWLLGCGGTEGIHTPVMFVAGSADEMSGYEKGTRAIYRGRVNADRYLLTFINANHNAAAPVPAPPCRTTADLAPIRMRTTPMRFGTRRA